MASLAELFGGGGGRLSPPLRAGGRGVGDNLCVETPHLFLGGIPFDQDRPD